MNIRNLFWLFLLLSGFMYSQSGDFIEIKNVTYSTEWLTDTISSTSWNKKDNLDKIRVRNRLIKLNQIIKNDSIPISRILLHTTPKKIKIGTNPDSLYFFELKKVSKAYAFLNGPQCYTTDEKTYETISLQKNTGIKEVLVYFTEYNRYVKVKIDTSFSEVYIQIFIKSEFEEFVNPKDKNFHPIIKLDRLENNNITAPPIPENIDVIDILDTVNVYYRI